jgi:Arc/MetJ-type ribon-helix-helix transcriptional regulator
VSKQFEDEVRARVAHGPYHSVEEFLRQSIERADEYHAQLRAAIDEGTAQARRGELTDGEAFLDRMEAELLKEESDEHEE